MIVQVCHARHDSYHEVSSEDLRKVYRLRLEDRKTAFMALSERVEVGHVLEADTSLVMDGVFDAKSWEELAEELSLGEDG